jgi:hypothetical protein
MVVMWFAMNVLELITFFFFNRIISLLIVVAVHLFVGLWVAGVLVLNEFDVII